MALQIHQSLTNWLSRGFLSVYSLIQIAWCCCESFILSETLEVRNNNSWFFQMFWKPVFFAFTADLTCSVLQASLSLSLSFECAHVLLGLLSGDPFSTHAHAAFPWNIWFPVSWRASEEHNCNIINELEEWDVLSAFNIPLPVIICRKHVH